MLNLKEKQKFKKHELIKRILLTIAGIGGLTALLAIAAIAPNSLQMLQLFKLGNQRKIKRAVKRMRKQKFIEVFEKNGEEFVKITESGKQIVLKFKLNDLKIIRPKKWDGRWRIVVFDIPNKRKSARDALRIKLRELGFLKLQRSVFIFPFPCKDEIDFVTEFFHIRQYVNYIEASSVENEYRIKNHFQI